MAFTKPLVLTSKTLFFTLLGGVAGLFILILLTPPWREGLRNWMSERSRTVLAQTQGDLTGQGDSVTVLKVKTMDSIILEVYENDGQGQPVKFRGRVVLPEARDGYVKFRGGSTN